jgi:hypothetical protein
MHWDVGGPFVPSSIEIWAAPMVGMIVGIAKG